MITLSVKADVKEVVRDLDRLQRKQIPFATAVALTKTAQATRDALRLEMKRVFDQPTRFTLNSLRVQPARKNKLEAAVFLKDFAPKGTPADKYLRAQISGGPRRQKRFERWLEAHGYLPRGMFAVPGQGARLNRYGNMSQGQITQILSALRALPGGIGNRSASKSTPYFVMPPGRSAPPGVYKRMGRNIVPVLVFVRAPNYARRFRFFAVAERTARREFSRQFEAAMRKARRTAR